MAKTFCLPAVGDTMVEAEIVDWLVEVGDEIALDQPICSIETDKSVVEMTTPYRGVVLALGGEPGDVIAVGEPLITVGEPGEELPAASPGIADTQATSKPGEPRTNDDAGPPETVTTVLGVVTEEPPATEAATAATTEPGSFGTEVIPATTTEPVRAMPRVRKLARERSVDLTTITGTGPHGAITVADLGAVTNDSELSVATAGNASESKPGIATAGNASESKPGIATAGNASESKPGIATAGNASESKPGIATAGNASESKPGIATAGNASESKPGIATAGNASESKPGIATAGNASESKPVVGAAAGGAVGGSGRRQRLSAVRRSIARHLTESSQQIPQFTSLVELDAAALLATRAALAQRLDSPVPLDALLTALLVPVLQDHPVMNAMLDDDEIVYFDRYDIGIAVDAPGGLTVPVVHAADSLSVSQIATEILRLATAARDRTIQPSELAGATATVNNVGPLGLIAGTPILPLGTSMIAAFGKARPMVQLRQGSPVEIPVMTVSATFDHRIVDGGAAGRFLAQLKDHLEVPALGPLT